MKKRVPGKNLFTDKGAVMQTPTNKRPSDRRISLCVPAPLHNCIREIRYREVTTLRQLVEESIAPTVQNSNIDREPMSAKLMCTIPSDKTVTISVNVTQDQYNTLRAIKHYWNLSYSAFIVDALIKYIVQTYGERHQDIPEITELKKAIQTSATLHNCMTA